MINKNRKIVRDITESLRRGLGWLYGIITGSRVIDGRYIYVSAPRRLMRLLTLREETWSGRAFMTADDLPSGIH